MRLILKAGAACCTLDRKQQNMRRYVGWIPQWREHEPEESAAWETATALDAAIEEYGNALSYRHVTRDLRAKVWIKCLVTGEVTKHALFFDAAKNEIRPVEPKKSTKQRLAAALDAIAEVPVPSFKAPTE
jgi:hypothetical protein